MSFTATVVPRFRKDRNTALFSLIGDIYEKAIISFRKFQIKEKPVTQLYFPSSLLFALPRTSIAQRQSANFCCHRATQSDQISKILESSDKKCKNEYF